MLARRFDLTTKVFGTILGVARTANWLLALNGFQNLAWAPRAVPGTTVVGRPRVSVLVPARDEARNIAACVESLLSQSFPPDEILVLDDQSTDGTVAIVERIASAPEAGRLRSLPGSDPPMGWSGKNWACHQLGAAAHGDWLLFTDADTRHHPDCLAAALDLARRYDADLVSLLPRQRLITLGERLLLPQLPLIIHTFLPLCLVPRRERWAIPFAGAFGPYLLFRRSWYERLGGHAAIRDMLGEDMQFAVAAKRQGGRVVLADGCAVLDCRMYTGFAEVWRGLTRNAQPAARGSVVALALFGLAWALLFVMPPFAALALVMRQVRDRRRAEGALTRLALVATGGQLALRLAIGQRHGWPCRDVALQPLGACLLLGVLVDSWYRHRIGAVTWRSRRCGDRVAVGR
ncbi:MAG TPA: glycosyltransferase family 2 protein [Thermomicrobiales bacterium]|jgi:chlorobactene glucosyltransferase